MDSRQDKSRKKWRRALKASKKERIKVLIDRGYINSGSDVPEGAIPARPYLQNTDTGSWMHDYSRSFYEEQKFVCLDCGEEIVWSAEEQAWAYEVVGIPAIASLKRCTFCRLAFEKKRDKDVKRMHEVQARRKLEKN